MEFDAHILEATFAYIVKLLSFPFSPSSRYHAINWIPFLIGGVAVYIMMARRGDKPSRTPLGFLFPKDVWLHQSTRVDAKLLISNRFISFGRAGIRVVSTSAVAAFVAMMFAPALGGFNLDLTAAWMVVLCVTTAMANDLAGYVNHRLGHEVKLLWPFHRVHHSAEVMSPLTLQRKHPVYGFIGGIIQPLIAGPVMGLTFAVFGELGYWQIFGINAAYAIFALTGAHFRHSHIWINYPAWISRIFVSPAMHQIHHSIDPKHYDKNYGEIFALWDWMFGTLYVPRAKESLVYGVLDDELVSRVQPHPTLKDAYVEPFLAFAAELKAISERAEAADRDETAAEAADAKKEAAA